jgi:VirB8 protein
MTNAKTITSDSDIAARPKYYEPYGAEIASGNRAWVVAALMSAVALLSLAMLFFVRMQPPTVIRIGPTGEAVVLGKPGSGTQNNSAASGRDAFLDQAFVKRFLANYLNYSPANVDDRWASSLNMMTRNRRNETLKALAADNTRGKIDDEQIQSVFHLREIDPDPSDPLAFLIYGVKDVHHLTNETEVTDHFVNEYRVRLIADRRSDVNPDGLWIADYSERPIDGERRDRILAATDREITNQ